MFISETYNVGCEPIKPPRIGISCLPSFLSMASFVPDESLDHTMVQESDSSVDFLLHVIIHHAQDIHNICIYGNQDVYAKFSITHCQESVFSTHPVKAGGKNPVFNQSLRIPVPRPDSVLKCEIWMMSCARNYLEDQLLGFVLVPLASLLGKGKLTQDYSLTSTDLFYTPAGTLCLSLLFVNRSSSSSTDLLEHEANGKMCEDNNLPIRPSPSSPVVMMECGQQSLAPADLSKIEFPDLEAASENQHLVSVLLKMAAGDARDYAESNGASEGEHEDGIAPENQVLSGPPRGHLHVSEMDCEMSSCSVEEKSPSPSSNASLSQVEAPKRTLDVSATEHISVAGEAPSINSPNGLISTDSFALKGAQSASSSSSGECSDNSPLKSNGRHGEAKALSTGQESEGSAFIAPLVSISVETEEPVVQQHIVDMYMKSMQQFTEKLAEMKLPLDMDAQDSSAVTRNTKLEKKGADEGKKEGHRVFYGSRAFF